MFKRSLLVAMIATVTAAQAAPLTKDNGAPVGDNQNSITAGPNGSVLLQDVQLVQKLQRFGRERFLSVSYMRVVQGHMVNSLRPKIYLILPSLHCSKRGLKLQFSCVFLP